MLPIPIIDIQSEHINFALTFNDDILKYSHWSFCHTIPLNYLIYLVEYDVLPLSIVPTFSNYSNNQQVNQFE